MCIRDRVLIYAFTDNELLFRQMLLLRGIEPFYMEFEHDHETTIQKAFSELKSSKWAKPGDPIITITKMYAGENLIDSTQIREIS